MNLSAKCNLLRRCGKITSTILKSKKIRIEGRNKTVYLEFFDISESNWFENKIFDLLDRKIGTCVNSSRFTTVIRFERTDTGEIFYFKGFHDRDKMEKLKAILRSTRGKRAFEAGKLLLKHGFLTPIPILYGEEKDFCLLNRRNFLITKEADGDGTYQYFEKMFPLPLTNDMIREKRILLNRMGHEIGRLHKKGIFHGDLRVGNIIIDGRGNLLRIFFIDNERTRQYKKLPMRKRLKNLVQLNMVLLPQITVSDRLRFLEAYLEENPFLIPYKKELIRKIHRLTQKRLYNKFLRANS